MKFLVPTIILTLLAAFVLGLMLFSWIKRKRRDAALLPSSQPLSGEVLAEFSRLLYVATTPADTPLERVAPPGLSFRGYADLAVLRDGVRVQVAGEPEVTFARAHIAGTQISQMTIDRVVEKDGLASLVWGAADESQTPHHTTFRFADGGEQRRFIEAVADMLRDATASTDAQPVKESQ